MKVGSQRIKNFLSAGVFMAFAMSLQADYHVALNGSNTSPYDTWAKAATNIQIAVTAAPSGSTIRVADGTYSAPSGKTSIIDISGASDKAKSLTFYGNTTNPAQVVLDGKGAQQGLMSRFSAANQTLDLNGFTFSNCYAIQLGGGFSFGATVGNFPCNATIKNCTFVENRVQGNGGGAMSFARGGGSEITVVLSNCVFYANRATSGGAIYASLIKSITLVDCRAVGNISDGTSASGGGAFNFNNSKANLLGCALLSNRCDNATTGGGGALYSYSDTVAGSCALTDCRFEENKSITADGGAVNSRGSLFATNCIFRNNRANSSGKIGGAICVNNTSPETHLYNCLIVGNLAHNGGDFGQAVHGVNGATGTYVIVNSTIVSNSGGVAVAARYDTPPAPIIEIRNSIILYNQRTNGTLDNYTYLNLPGVRKFYNTATFPMPIALVDGGGNITNDPKFVSLAGGDFHLQLGSPCIDTGLNQDWMIDAKDLDGRSRLDPHSLKVDMGCYEAQKAGTVVVIR